MSNPANSSVRIVSPVQRILIVDEIVRRERADFRAQSTPGHLIHIVESGEVSQRAEGRPEVFREGHVVWYHESEPIEGRIVRAPWRFITINFTAPELAPPAADRRVLRAGPNTLQLARKLLATWRARSMPAGERALRCFAVLCELILDVLPLDSMPAPAAIYPANARERWWTAERLLRRRLDRPANLGAIAEIAGMSVRTTIRACVAATGMTPVRRMKDLRLTYAHGLLQHADLTVREIAYRVGYARGQEFSRDMKKHAGRTPREIRNATPDYRRMKRGLA